MAAKGVDTTIVTLTLSSGRMVEVSMDGKLTVDQARSRLTAASEKFDGAEWYTTTAGRVRVSAVDVYDIAHVLR